MAPFAFLRAVTRDVHVGAVTRSSTYVVRNVATKVPRFARYIVEYGPGDGIITRALLALLPPDGRLIAIERSSTFCASLADIRDPRLRIICGDALAPPSAAVLGIPRVDAVVSGIPLTLFRAEERTMLIARTHALLAPQGTFVVYQYSPLVLPLLMAQFADVSVKLEPRNFLPYFIMTAQK